MSDLSEDSAGKHTIPVIERMMDVLDRLSHAQDGLSIRALTDQLELPRTTIYRILNTLQGRDVVRRDESGAYHLGHKLLALASSVSARGSDVDLAALAQPFLEKLSANLGEGAKLSIIDDDGVLVLATAQGRGEYALSISPGQRMPVHAGAASKILLAHLPMAQRDEWLAKPLMALTSKSITDPKRLLSELARIRRLGWAQDRGENAQSVQAFAAPVFNGRGELVAAISVPFLAGMDARKMEDIRLAVIEAGAAMSRAMPDAEDR
jgi:DNA-binding IclR family transcriptional regulator